MRTALLVLLLAGFVSGCATDQSKQTSTPVWNLTRDGQLLTTTNQTEHFDYKLQIHIVCAGDTVGMIAHRFHTSIATLKALNPDLDPRRLTIGMKILVAEEKIN